MTIDSKKEGNRVIEWKKDGLSQEVYLQYIGYQAIVNPQFQGRIKLVNGISLEISHIRAEDEGWYECQYIVVDGVKDKAGNGTWVYLDVNTPPKITNSSPSTLRHQQGATVTLFCQAEGSPEPHVEWTKDGEILTNSLRITLSPDRTQLTIRSLERSDGGPYSCTFRNSLGQVAQRIDLIVEGAAYILTAPVNTTAIAGQRIVFTCGADAFPTNITYHWFFKNQDVVTMRAYIKGRIQIKSTGDLVISPVEKDDMGWYICRPTNGVGRDPEAPAYLNVTYLPKVLSMPSVVTWALGLQAQLDCPVEANPAVSEYIWTKNNFMVAVHPDRITLLANGTLLIYNVRKSDEGSYSCQPVSPLGSGETSKARPGVSSERHLIGYPPQFTVRPLERYIQIPGDDVMFPCAATGSPTPNIHWRKVGGQIIFGPRFQLIGGNLTIKDLVKEDHGRYECEAENSVARMVISTELIVQMTTPHAPYNVTVSTKWFEATLRWIPAYNGGSPQYYFIWYRTVNSMTGQTSQWQQMRVEPQNATSFTIYMLQPDSLYQMKVLARNQYGDGTYSETVQARTLGNTGTLPTALPTDPTNGQVYHPSLDKPLGPRPFPPKNVTARNENGGIRISWKPANDANTTIFYYVIEMTTTNRWVKFNDHVQFPFASYFYEKVDPSTTYRFRVYAYSVLSYSYPSAVAIVTTPAAVTTSISMADLEAEPTGIFLSQAEIGGIVGGLLFLLVAILLVIIAVICSKRKERHRGDKYGNVKYIGPADEMDSHMPINRTQNAPEWDSWDAIGGTGSLNSVDCGNGIFVVPHSNEFYREDTLPVSAYFQESRMFDPDKCLFDPNRSGRSVSRSSNGRRSQTGRGRFSKPDTSDRQISGSMIGSVSGVGVGGETGRCWTSPDRNDTLKDKQSLQLSVTQLKDRSYPMLRSPVSDKNHDSDADDETDDENGFAPKRPPLPRGYRVPYKPEVYMGPHRHWGSGDPYSYPGDTDDVFSPPAGNRSAMDQPTFPRQSSMKPSSYQTYLTGDPVNESFGHYFGVEDLSSVHPSFVDKSLDRSHDTLPRLHPLSRPDLPGPQSFEFPSWRSTDSTLRDDGSRSTSRVHFDNSDFTVIERTLDGSSGRGRQVARVPPNQKDNLGRAGYTREHLQGAVDRVRRGPRALRTRSASRSSGQELDHSFDDRLPPVVPGRMTYLSDSVLPLRTGTSQYSDQDAPVPPRRGRLSHSDTEFPSRTDIDRHGWPYGYNIDFFKSDKGTGNRYSISSSGRGSSSSRMRPSSDSRGYTGDDTTPDSGSSGIGSKNTGSSGPWRQQRNNSASVTSLLGPHDTSQDSTHLPPDYSLRREASGDENYEFDVMDTLNKYSHIHPVGDELLSALENGLSTSNFYDDLYPKPTRQSRYDNSEERFQKLRQEFHQYQRQIHNQSVVDYYPAMDSEML
ncbi:protein turtle-like [Pecten maximus]|uniref:protein turtle-like n=1 Tax=Pecten maximus TaxID=6579 RepID=UPI00145880BF|nr:protein turtle-like [Pecten maximus]